MTPKAAQQKGDRFENHLVERLRRDLDRHTHRTTGSGNGLDKNDIRVPSLDLEIEAKNAATFNIQADWDQTKRQKTSGNMAVLVVRHPKQPEFKETLVVMDFEDFLALLQSQFTVQKGPQGPTTNETRQADRDVVFQANRAISEIKKLGKVLEERYATS